jgi:hypothetical protein
MDRLCTIIAQNYLPQAMALLESSRKVYPSIEFFILITDSEDGLEEYLPSATILNLSDLKVNQEWIQDMQSFYDPVEFATALKPFLLLTLLTPDTRTVTFLDPDIILFSELSEGISAGAEFGIALAPHRLTPSDITSAGYNEIGFLQYGIFNLGYICVGQEALPMLNWWGERLRWYCTRFPNDHIFTDQKWMNFIPALFNFKVIRNFGYDFAPWNIDERPLRLNQGEFTAGDSKLVFIHFSQMSGDLASGRPTPLWSKTITSSQEDMESFALISQLTDEYSSKLIGFKDQIKRSQKNIDIISKPKIHGFHRRKKLIESSLAFYRGFQHNQKNSRHNFELPSICINLNRMLERSDTVNGLRVGLRRDSQRLARKVRSFLQK